MKQTLFFRTYGSSSSEPLIILHGLLGSSDNWQYISKKLSSQYYVVVPDLRNHGQSFHATTHTLADMTEDILHLLLQSQHTSCHLLGHSMGGKVAMHLANWHSTCVRRLVIADISFRSYSPVENTQLLEILMNTPISKCSTRKACEELLCEAFPDARLRMFLLKNLARQSDHTFYWRPNLSILLKDLSHIMQNVPLRQAPFNKPTLLLRALRANYVKDSDIPLMRKMFPHLQISNFTTGHWIQAEQPQHFVEVLQDFLTQKV